MPPPGGRRGLASLRGPAAGLPRVARRSRRARGSRTRRGSPGEPRPRRAGHGAAAERTPRWSKASRSSGPLRRAVNGEGAAARGDAGTATAGGERSGGHRTGEEARARGSTACARASKPGEPQDRQRAATCLRASGWRKPSRRWKTARTERVRRWQRRAEARRRTGNRRSERGSHAPGGDVDGGAIFETTLRKAPGLPAGRHEMRLRRRSTQGGEGRVGESRHGAPARAWRKAHLPTQEGCPAPPGKANDPEPERWEWSSN